MSEKAFQAKVLQLARLNGWAWYHPYDSRRSNPGFPGGMQLPVRRVAGYTEVCPMRTQSGVGNTTLSTSGGIVTGTRQGRPTSTAPGTRTSARPGTTAKAQSRQTRSLRSWRSRSAVTAAQLRGSGPWITLSHSTLVGSIAQKISPAVVAPATSASTAKTARAAGRGPTSGALTAALQRSSTLRRAGA
jgi:hypothetical protein